mmetsp:Transcript_14241/g.44826  ORF Transcript_14241/g.44826 Transcript_14241/m.44826 type:complete len:708 (-) Transcript_14241:44-2167(-)
MSCLLTVALVALLSPSLGTPVCTNELAPGSTAPQSSAAWPHAGFLQHFLDLSASVRRLMMTSRSFFLIQPTGPVDSSTFSANILVHFDGMAGSPYQYEYEGEVTVNLDATSSGCADLNSAFTNPFLGNPTGVYLVSMWKPSVPVGTPPATYFRLLPGSEAVAVADLTEQQRVNLMQILGAERDAAFIADLLPKLGLQECAADCAATGAVCATADYPFTSGCVCPLLSAWSTTGNTLTCDSSKSFTDIVPGARILDRYDSRDTWQRGTRATVSWTYTGEATPMRLNLVPTNEHDAIIDEPLVVQLSAQQVQEGSVEIELPVDFAPTARFCHVAFATQDALEVAPQSWGRFVSIGLSFVLASPGCIVNDQHGECVPAAECGGARDASRINGGTGTCANLAAPLAGSSLLACCLPNTATAEVPSSGWDKMEVLLPDDIPVLYVGQTVPIRFVAPSNGIQWALSDVVYASSVDEEETPEWFVSSTKVASQTRFLANYAEPGRLVNAFQTDGEAWSVYEIDYEVRSANAVQTTSLPSEVATLQLTLAGVVWSSVDIQVRFAPCAPSRGDNGFFGDEDFTSVNTVGQCASSATCEAVQGAVNDAESFAFIDTEDLCGDSLGEDAVCCYRAGNRNDGFRAADNAGADEGLGTAAIVAIVAGALCLVGLAVTVCCAVAVVATRRRSAAAKVHHANTVSLHPRSRRVSRRPSHANI